MNESSESLSSSVDHFHDFRCPPGRVLLRASSRCRFIFDVEFAELWKKTASRSNAHIRMSTKEDVGVSRTLQEVLITGKHLAISRDCVDDGVRAYTHLCLLGNDRQVFK